MYSIEILSALALGFAIAGMLGWILFRPGRLAARSGAAADQMQPYVVAVDGSKESSRAVDLACGLAAEKHAKLLLGNVICVPLQFALDAPFPRQDYEAKRVLEFAQALVRGKHVECESRIVKDRTVAAGLAELARANHASMVIVGLDGSAQKGLQDLLVVSDLFRHTPCEVLVAHEPIEGARDNSPIGRLIEPSFLG